MKNPKSSIKKPAVLGAVIDLGWCLDLLDSKFLQEIKITYDTLCNAYKIFGLKLPENIVSKNGELLVRKLDCAVIQATHTLNISAGGNDYDSVRGVFLKVTICMKMLVLNIKIIYKLPLEIKTV